MHTADGADSLNLEQCSTTPVDADNPPTPSEKLTPYLQAARKAPKPLTRLLPAAAGGRPKTIVVDATFSAKLRHKAERMTATWVGHEPKNLMEIKSDTPLASPTHLRQILSFSGVRPPSLSYLLTTPPPCWPAQLTPRWTTSNKATPTSRVSAERTADHRPSYDSQSTPTPPTPPPHPLQRARSSRPYDAKLTAWNTSPANGARARILRNDNATLRNWCTPNVQRWKEHQRQAC